MVSCVCEPICFLSQANFEKYIKITALKLQYIAIERLEIEEWGEYFDPLRLSTFTPNLIFEIKKMKC